MEEKGDKEIECRQRMKSQLMKREFYSESLFFKA